MYIPLGAHDRGSCRGAQNVTLSADLGHPKVCNLNAGDSITQHSEQQ